MIRSVLTMLAAMALMVVSLTASAHAMRADDGAGHQVQMVAEAMAAAPACDGGGDALCAFACSGVVNLVGPERLAGSCGYGSAIFFVAHAPHRAGRGPEEAERPPRLMLR